MWKKIYLLICFLLIIGVISHARAATIETDDIRLGINGYINTIYTYMGKMPMDGSSGTVSAHRDMSTFEGDTHILFNAVKDKLRMNLNITFHNGTLIEGSETGDDITGEFGLIETFGEYAFNKHLQVRAGNFLSPFGIYNQIRFLTPLFATVVLPMMYEPPHTYAKKALIPENANIMISGAHTLGVAGIDYYLYGGNGELGKHGNDENKDKGVGGRIILDLPYNLKIGGSYYTMNDEPDTNGRERFYGGDLDITAGGLNLQSEYAMDKADKVEKRFAYYARLTYYIDQFSPFIAYDYFKDKDKGDTIFRRGMHRYSLGTGYFVNNHVTLKGEYHLHRLTDSGGPGDVPDDSHMFRLAAIFIF